VERDGILTREKTVIELLLDQMEKGKTECGPKTKEFDASQSEKKSLFFKIKIGEEKGGNWFCDFYY